MTYTDYIAIGALVVAVISLLYTFFTNTKKYELSESLRQEIMAWFNECMDTLVLLRGIIEFSTAPDEQEKLHLNLKLYSLTERGRFYFPNYDRTLTNLSSYEAYRGHRSLLLDLLSRSYAITKLSTAEIDADKAKKISLLKKYQKAFTSEMFKLLNPDSYIRAHTKNTDFNISHHKTFSTSEYN